MLVQKTIQVVTFSLDIFEGVKAKTIEFIRTNAAKISAVSMAGKMFMLTVLFAIVPMGTIPVSHSYNTEIKFDKTTSSVVVPANKTIQITLGESEVDRVEREKREAEARASGTFYSAPASTHNDPSDFRQIYIAAGARFGVPWQLIEAVHEVETGKSGSTDEASYAGATGPMQFIPSTWRIYGVDGNGDGVSDITDVTDAIYGAANLLAQSGAAEGNIDAALYNYNHAQWYVNKVKAIAYEIGM